MMDVTLFLQNESQSSTLGQIVSAVQVLDPDWALFSYAYATYTGCTEFTKNVDSTIWNRPTRWLLGIDYGRTQPSALSYLNRKSNTQIRIFDGQFVVNSPGFKPRRDFHMKACLLNSQANGLAAVAGSGNFSANGLLNSVECGTRVITAPEAELTSLHDLFDAVEELWMHATPLGDVYNLYEQRWTPGAVSRSPQQQPQFQSFKRFWIEAGYITPNRGANRPGNQFDMPRGAHRFFGLTASPNQQPNTIIGPVTFVGNGPSLTQPLRFGNNHMERLTLPFPEQYPFGTYVGKIIEFERVTGGYRVNAFELEDFEVSTKTRPSKLVLKMNSGRAYGFR